MDHVKTDLLLDQPFELSHVERRERKVIDFEQLLGAFVRIHRRREAGLLIVGEGLRIEECVVSLLGAADTTSSHISQYAFIFLFLII